MQAGYEKTQSFLLTMLAGANIIYGAGMLDLGMTFSYTQYVADDEIVRMLSRILRGIPTDDEHLAVDIIKEVGIGGEFLSHPHTFQNLKHNIFPTMIDRDDRDTWGLMGKKTLMDSAKEKAIDIIENREIPALPCADQLTQLIADAEKEFGVTK